MIECGLHWTEYVKSIGPTLIALFVAYVAYQQWHVNRTNLREKLFDRRVVIYDQIRNALSQIMRDARADAQSIHEQGMAWHDSRFLFGAEVSDYLKKIRDAAIEMGFHENSISPEMKEADKQKHIKGKFKHLKWLANQFEPLNEKFLPYLGFKDRY